MAPHPDVQHAEGRQARLLRVRLDHWVQMGIVSVVLALLLAGLAADVLPSSSEDERFARALREVGETNAKLLREREKIGCLESQLEEKSDYIVTLKSKVHELKREIQDLQQALKSEEVKSGSRVYELQVYRQGELERKDKKIRNMQQALRESRDRHQKHRERSDLLLHKCEQNVFNEKDTTSWWKNGFWFLFVGFLLVSLYLFYSCVSQTKW